MASDKGEKFSVHYPSSIGRRMKVKSVYRITVIHVTFVTGFVIRYSFEMIFEELKRGEKAWRSFKRFQYQMHFARIQ